MKWPGNIFAAGFLVSILMLTAAAPGEDGRSLESISLSKAAGPAPVAREANSGTTGVFSVWRVLGAMGCVLGAILAVRWVGRRFLGLPTSRSSSGVIQVLCRSVLSPRQQLMLVQVGRRMVLVADCGSQMNPLCEITDPDEMAELGGKIQQQTRDSVSSSFKRLLGRAAAPYESTEGAEKMEDEAKAPAGEDVPPGALAKTREELGGLLEKVRLISRHFQKA